LLPGAQRRLDLEAADNGAFVAPFNPNKLPGRDDKRSTAYPSEKAAPRKHARRWPGDGSRFAALTSEENEK